MCDAGYSKAELLSENKKLRNRIEELEHLQKQYERTQAELRETRDHLQAILDAIPGTVSWIDSEFRYLGVNRLLAETFGLPAEAFIGKEVGFLGSSSAFGDYVNEVFCSSNSFFFKEIESNSEGKRLIHLIGSQKYHNGKRAVFVGIDITVRKLAEEVLRESEERYRSFVENLQGIAYRKTLDFKPIFYHGAVEQVCGYSEEDFTSGRKEWEALVYKDDLAVYNQMTQRIREFKTDSEGIEYRIVLKDGQIRWIRENCKVIHDHAGEPVFIQGTIYDINSQKETEEALQVSEENYRKFFEEDLTGDYISTPDGELLFCNSAFAEIFGFDSVANALHYNLNRLYPESASRGAFIDALKKEGKLNLTEVELRDRHGRPVFVVENTIGTFDEEGELIRIRGYLFDITERKKLEAQVRQAQKMEAIGTLAGGIAHDFNNLLTTIQGYTDLAITSLDDDNPIHRHLNQIRRAAGRAGSLTNQLLLFSRKQSIELNSINVNEIIENIFKMLNRLIGEDIEINMELAPECWRIWGDVGNIEQIIMNLAINARDAMPKGGLLTIGSENRIIDENYCRKYNYAHPGKFVCLTISDTGTGIEDGIKQHIFEPFFTTKEAGKGTGLGLSVVYGIIKQHNGWINMNSIVGSGTSFELFLPVSASYQEESGHQGNHHAIFPAGGGRILLVEDEDGIREFANEVLKLQGYDIVSATNVNEALQIFRSDQQPFDLLFTDVVLPDNDGLHLVDMIKNDNPEIRILLTSGYTDQKSQWPEIRRKGYRFLQKPYSMRDLLQYVADALKEE